MPWSNSPADRARQAATYGPEFRAARAQARRRAGGRCEQCHHAHPRLQCDHIVNTASTGRPDHSLGNLQMLCAGAGSCKCHERKTAAEGNGFRRRPDPAPQPRTKW